MIHASDCKEAITLIGEAVAVGAREAVACKELGLTQRTLQRWRKQGGTEDGRPNATRPAPANKLSEAEEQQVLHILQQPQNRSLPPVFRQAKIPKKIVRFSPSSSWGIFFTALS
ncbi:helix-turn-helix domain-containing protein [Paenibacillus sp. GCM10012307]|uniref:Helix-turn-helix domain-containing protein n=1 Tax=Paenibacillus roseus TaxID=2798579 RepID=A0A934JBT7_9BACL|nr:helix-turn-helix domain-containing protein [Paenibacillus roseus]MBJ6363928.1 helix-turn-helix domain-containing protein [Paenibacillus roseus]